MNKEQCDNLINLIKSIMKNNGSSELIPKLEVTFEQLEDILTATKE